MQSTLLRTESVIESTYNRADGPAQELATGSRSAGRFARRARRARRARNEHPVRDALIIAFQLVLLSVVCLFIYNGVEQLQHSKNHHELIKRQRLLRAHQLLLQYDSNHDKKISDAEINFAALNSYQY